MKLLLTRVGDSLPGSVPEQDLTVVEKGRQTRGVLVDPGLRWKI